ncbi:hypothetical protein [Sphingomonas olei]|uniref:hypothetical protein n=1 Tax=Sphingomonas olei TaxID=1886787 RepID=UPI001455B7FC|nr:hypothetical protein [Sphingomonas olei]
MTGGPQMWLLALMLILPISALVARRLPMRQSIKLALIWIVLFGVVTLVFTQIEQFAR